MYIFTLSNKLKETKMKDLKNKVIARLVRCGHNEENATAWTNEHFEYVNKHYSGVAKIAEVISSL